MFTEQILKSILSLKTFSAPARGPVPALAGIHISVNVESKTITALATDRYAAARMVITVPEVGGTSWERNVSIATLNAALATVKAGGYVSVFPEAYMPDFPASVSTIIDKCLNYEDAEHAGDFNAKHLGAISKVNVGGDKSGRWTLRPVHHGGWVTLTATATHGTYDGPTYDVAVVIMPLPTRN